MDERDRLDDLEARVARAEGHSEGSYRVLLELRGLLERELGTLQRPTAKPATRSVPCPPNEKMKLESSPPQLPLTHTRPILTTEDTGTSPLQLMARKRRVKRFLQEHSQPRPARTSKK